MPGRIFSLRPSRPLRTITATPLTGSGQRHALHLIEHSQSHHPPDNWTSPGGQSSPERKNFKRNQKPHNTSPYPLTPSQQPPYPLPPYPLSTTTMATQPKIDLLPPTPSISKTYSATLRSCTQQTSPLSSSLPPTPQTFLDAMLVREAVFVDEQKVALENEFDEEDPRCWHWVLYAPGESESEPKPAGTIRLVPFPQLGEEPRAGGVYFGGELTNAEELLGGCEFFFPVCFRDVGPRDVDTAANAPPPQPPPPPPLQTENRISRWAVSRYSPPSAGGGSRVFSSLPLCSSRRRTRLCSTSASPAGISPGRVWCAAMRRWAPWRCGRATGSRSTSRWGGGGRRGWSMWACTRGVRLLGSEGRQIGVRSYVTGRGGR